MKILGFLWLGLLSALGWAAPEPVAPSVAFFYGAKPPWSDLQAFDVVVVDPDHVPNPQVPALRRTRLAAYVALGEVQPTRAYAARIPKAWLVGDNKDWGSLLIDQSRPEWPRFFADEVIAPLWKNGYRTVFLDTLDSYHLFAKTPEQRAVQEAGMVAVIQMVAQRFPGIKLIFNRGFEILPKTHSHVEAVVAESLFQGFDAGKQVYKEVSAADREWLLAQLRQAKGYGLNVVVIDYVAPGKRALARSTAERIRALGFMPWVTTPDLNTMGVGSIEVMPRRVAVIHSAVKDEYALREIGPVRAGAMPLQYFGYVPEYFDVKQLPAYSLAGRFAAVLVWLDADPPPADQTVLQAWLTKQLDEELPIGMLGAPSFLMESALGKRMGFALTSGNPSTLPVKVMQQDPMMAYERAPSPQPAEFYPLSVQAGQPLLTLARGEQTQVAAALTPWGGYVLPSYDVVTLPGNSGDRWVVDPFAFFKQALRLPDMPVPDVTTESGRRMLMVHMDGDGFISRSELRGNLLAGEVVRDRVVKTYDLPMTISVIEAELSPTGLYPGLSALAEKVAQDIFRAPNVAIASHSYSHPFYWGKVNESDPNGGYNLRLPGYRFDLEREVNGSIKYIESRLAPPGKKVEMFLWTGDCVPGAAALAKTTAAGVYNMNGGDTTATRSSPTMTEVEGLGMTRGEGYQVFAPNQNENVYTNNWLGPFYGFERVIETFEFTESPRRLKPIDIYFHTYIATKAAGMQSLDKVFGYALSQETTPVHLAQYAQKVLDFQNVAVARHAGGWRVRGMHDLRTLRWPVSLGQPDMVHSAGVAGFSMLRDQGYAHLGDDQAELVFAADPGAQVRLVSANGQVVKFLRQGSSLQWTLTAHVPLKFTLANVQSCRIKVGGREVKAVRQSAEFSHFEIKDHVASPLEAICRG